MILHICSEWSQHTCREWYNRLNKIIFEQVRICILNLPQVIFLSWMLSLTIVIVLFVLWMRSSVANEEKERQQAFEARKVLQSQMSAVTQPHTAVSIPPAKSMNDYHSRVSIETNSRTSSGLSPQSLPLLSATASPCTSEQNKIQIYDPCKLSFRTLKGPFIG